MNKNNIYDHNVKGNYQNDLNCSMWQFGSCKTIPFTFVGIAWRNFFILFYSLQCLELNLKPFSRNLQKYSRNNVLQLKCIHALHIWLNMWICSKYFLKTHTLIRVVSENEARWNTFAKLFSSKLIDTLPFSLMLFNIAEFFHTQKI